jgi:hypothetical protein
MQNRNGTKYFVKIGRIHTPGTTRAVTLCDCRECRSGDYNLQREVQVLYRIIVNQLSQGPGRDFQGTITKVWTCERDVLDCRSIEFFVMQNKFQSPLG